MLDSGSPSVYSAANGSATGSATAIAFPKEVSV
jgi:hypothetical protein